MRVADAAELAAVAARMLGDADELGKMRAAALGFAKAHRGATVRTVALIRSVLTS
jgi:3-deoxy-D-manno-octulosonic-acid transferase